MRGGLGEAIKHYVITVLPGTIQSARWTKTVALPLSLIQTNRCDQWLRTAQPKGALCKSAAAWLLPRPRVLYGLPDCRKGRHLHERQKLQSDSI